jgi:ATP/maltotriose-dependent transcriptional regulator MalT
VPAERDGFRLDRPVLGRRLAAVLDRGAVQLVAPPGGGKTTALEDAAAARGGAIAWVTCEPADADPGRLLARIIGAIQVAAPGAADPLAARLAAATEAVRPLAAARALAAELAERLTEPLTIVVDDAEHLAATDAPDVPPTAAPGTPTATAVPGAPVAAASGAPHATAPGASPAGTASGAPPGLTAPDATAAPWRGTAAGVVAVLAAAPAPLLRVAVGSAAELPIPGERIGAEALAFTREECAALGEGEAWEPTGGWPLGVALAARTGRPLAPGEPLDGHLGALVGDLDQELRAVLVDAAAASAIDATVLRALQPPDGFAEALRRSGIPLHERDSAIRLHPLVREALGRLLARERPSEYRELLHARLAAALDAAGHGAEAVEHWLEVPEEAAAAVARHGSAVVDTAPATVARWLERIVGPARLAPELHLLEGRLAVGDGRLPDAAVPLRDAVLGFEARGDEAAAWAARLALVDVLGMLERYEAAVPLASGFDRSRAPAAPMVAVTAAASLAGIGAFDEAVDLFERAVAGPSGAPFAPFADAFRAAWVDLQLGELDAALDRVRGAVAALERDDPFGRLAYVVLTEAVVLEERGEDAAALETAARARDLGEYAAPGGTVSDLGRRFTAGVLARLGRAEEAEAELAALDGPGAGWYAGDLHVTRAMIASTRGDHALALEEARRAIDDGALRTWRTRARTVTRLVPVLTAAAAAGHGPGATGGHGHGATGAAAAGHGSAATGAADPLDADTLLADTLAAAPPLASVARLRALREA